MNNHNACPPSCEHALLENYHAFQLEFYLIPFSNKNVIDYMQLEIGLMDDEGTVLSEIKFYTNFNPSLLHVYYKGGVESVCKKCNTFVEAIIT